MADLRKTPSVQHAVALIRPTVAATLLELEKLDGGIPFTLNPGRKLFKPLMEGQSLDWAIRQVEADKHAKNIKPNKELVTAFSPYATGANVPWFRECQSYGFPIGGGVVIPVRPSGFWAKDGKLRVLWVQSWKGRTLDPLQRAIFNTILRQTFFVGDFKDAALEFVDLREAVPKAGRSIDVVDGDKLGTVTQDELTGALEILLAAFELHSERKAERRSAERAERAEKKRKDRGPDLFDPRDPPAE
ncbi:hypothetical protein V7S57_03990 [Caulobacter sp. CCNWLY153]|uniref:hypothetical protein n=1 Tax=unclassified Caulobacter TaxID=2648921 RepID=UPI002FF211B3